MRASRKSFPNRYFRVSPLFNRFPSVRAAQDEKGKKVEEKKADGPSVAEFLLGRLVQGQGGGDPEAPPPRIRDREDYYAVLKQKQPP